MVLRVLASLTVITTGCSSLLSIHDPSTTDAPPNGGDGDGPCSTCVDVQPEGLPVIGSPLLLTEGVLSPNESEMIEIVNTSDQAIDLTNFYLSDFGNYFRLPSGVPLIDANDFIVRFPAGMMIQGRGVVTIAVATTAEFTTAYGIPPTLSIASATVIVVGANGLASLTNGGEMLALFEWDGQSDVVRDADLMLIGSPSLANSLIDKSNVQIDGPDADAIGTAYKADAGALLIQMGTPPGDTSTKRILLETGHETQTGGGNGIAGQDETSEDTRTTWDSVVFTAPTPGQVPAVLLP